MKQIGRALGAVLICGGALLLTPSLLAQNPSPGDILTTATNEVSPTLIGPHHLEVQATVLLGDGKTEKGTYSLDWAAPDRFREEIHLPGYDEISVASGMAMYRRRTAEYVPARVFQLEKLMHPDAVLGQFRRSVDRLIDETKLDPQHGEETVAGQLGVTRNQIGKTESECVAVGVAIPEECVDAKHGWPLEITEDTPDIDEKVQFSDYGPIGRAHLPRERQYIENGVAILQARVKKATSVQQFDPATFAPPAGAEQLSWCSDMMPSVRKAIQAPASVSEDDFPETEVLYGLVGADGTLKRYSVIESGGPKADAAMQILAGLIHFTPATCSGKPVESEAEFVVSDLDFLPPISEAVAPVAGKDGFGNPKCDFCPVPPYTPDGFQAGVNGSVVLSVIVAQDGRAHYVRILKRLGFGLDEHAARFVRNSWRFTPARGPDGETAAVRATIKVTYDLRNNLVSELLLQGRPLHHPLASDPKGGD